MTFIYIILILLVLSFGSCRTQKNTPPNFLFLVADDAGWQDFGCYDNPHIATPNIDGLAEAGIKANNAFLTAPQCSPSRISVLTGKYAHSTGAEDLHMPLPDSETVLPTYLKQQDYFSGYLKKGHLGPHGENQFDWYSKDLDDFNVFLDSVNTSPFFMWVGFTDPHRPYEKGIIDDEQQPDAVIVPSYLVDDQQTRQDLADYYNEIRRMDQQIGKYIEILEARNLLTNTVIVFFSDNGAPFPRAKGSLYDAGIKTPLIVSWPGKLQKNVELNGLVSVIDLAPTVLEISGISIPRQMQGKSILNLLEDPGLTGGQYVFSERNWHNCDEHMRSVRTSKFKYITNAYTEFPHGSASDITASPSWQSLYHLKQSNQLTAEQALIFTVPRPARELYDLRTDPEEFNNVAEMPEYAETIKTLDSILTKWQQDTGDFPPEERRRNDNVHRISGIKFDQTKLPPRPDVD